MSRALALAFALFLFACLAPRPPAEPRYFSPGGTLAPVETPARETRTGPELRLRRVVASDHLRLRMVWRRGVEVGFHDLWRWTQPPASYAEARVARELFELRDLRRATRPDAASLAVSLVAFEELLEPDHEAVVALDVILVDRAQVSLLDRTFTARRPLSSGDPEEVARALGEALSDAAGEAGAAVEVALVTLP